jgi:hypothetical protein
MFIFFNIFVICFCLTEVCECGTLFWSWFLVLNYVFFVGGSPCYIICVLGIYLFRNVFLVVYTNLIVVLSTFLFSSFMG